MAKPKLWTNVGTWATFDYFFAGEFFRTSMFTHELLENIRSEFKRSESAERPNLAIVYDTVLVDSSTFDSARSLLWNRMKSEHKIDTGFRETYCHTLDSGTHEFRFDISDRKIEITDMKGFNSDSLSYSPHYEGKMDSTNG